MASQAVGTIGAVIMPHNLFLHSSLVLSRDVDRSSTKSVRTANKYNAIECTGTLLFSFIVNMAVVGTYASSFFNHECAVADGGPYVVRENFKILKYHTHYYHRSNTGTHS